jgi:Tol biopolymer transport system component
MPACWSPGGDQIGFSANEDPERGYGFAIDITGGVPKKVTPEGGYFPCWSPDGRWIYYNALTADDRWNIFKIAAAAGSTPEQMTTDGGEVPRVTSDGQVFFWREGETIWRIPDEGAEEVLVLDKSIHVLDWSTWKENIVYINDTIEAGPLIERLSLKTGETRILQSFDKETILGAGVTVSPDGQWILYSQAEVLGADLMWVDSFY